MRARTFLMWALLAMFQATAASEEVDWKALQRETRSGKTATLDFHNAIINSPIVIPNSFSVSPGKLIIQNAEFQLNGLDASAISGNEIANLTIRNITITAPGRHGIALFGGERVGLRDIVIQNIKVFDAGKVGVLIGTLNNRRNYAALENIQIKNVSAVRAKQHGIAVIGPANGVSIIDSSVSESARGGNFWGIYGAPRGAHYGGRWEDLGSGIYRMNLKALGFSNETVKSLIVRERAPYKLEESEYYPPQLGQWKQRGDYVAINLERNPMRYPLGVVINTSSFNDMQILRSSAVRTFASGGRNDGTGIGFDLGARNGRIEDCVATRNEGRGIELHLCADCQIVLSRVSENQTYGVLINTPIGGKTTLMDVDSKENGKGALHLHRIDAASVVVSKSALDGNGESCVKGDRRRAQFDDVNMTNCY